MYFQKRASTLKRHLQRYHITAHDILAESCSAIADIALNIRPLGLKRTEVKKEKAEVKKEKGKIVRRLDPVYDLFVPSEDQNVVFCEIDKCSTRLAVSKTFF